MTAMTTAVPVWIQLYLSCWVCVHPVSFAAVSFVSARINTVKPPCFSSPCVFQYFLDFLLQTDAAYMRLRRRLADQLRYWLAMQIVSCHVTERHDVASLLLLGGDLALLHSICSLHAFYAKLRAFRWAYSRVVYGHL